MWGSANTTKANCFSRGASPVSPVAAMATVVSEGDPSLEVAEGPPEQAMRNNGSVGPLRLLERGFLCERLGGKPLEGWYESLIDSLSRPATPLTLVEALAVRMRRNDVWLFLTLYGSWWLKLGLAKEPILQAAHIGPLPGWLTASIATALLVPCIVLSLRAPKLLPG